ncbi:hypothetical protein ASAP_0889 [Asaia bogorensis]|uniref:Uncharacterized protein n=1 Tax=Asaia bogorensis TaxID=91915 RepID=A0A060QCR2_9PROT|nr:hypothetical protein ASAP_0889 [Asaia bogorensis]
MTESSDKAIQRAMVFFSEFVFLTDFYTRAEAVRGSLR